MEDKDTWIDRLKNLVADDWKDRLIVIILVGLILIFLVVIVMNNLAPTIGNVYNWIDYPCTGTLSCE